eukprot:4266074-Karenia_brevis.AAC.1
MFFGVWRYQLAFCPMGLPQALQSYFTLPSVEAWRLGISHVQGFAVPADVLIMAEIAVLPMGWSHALHCC